MLEKVQNFLPEADLLYAWVLEAVELNPWSRDTDTQCQAKYKAPITQIILHRKLPDIERITGKELWPTYSFTRFYEHGSVLTPHIDRPSCEFSASILLGGESNDLHIEGYPPVSFNPGDAVIYDGTKIKHWRDPYTGDHFAQLFLHYVDKRGPYADRRDDVRTD